MERRKAAAGMSWKMLQSRVRQNDGRNPPMLKRAWKTERRVMTKGVKAL